MYIRNSPCQNEPINLTHQNRETDSRITAHLYNNMYVIEAYAPCEGENTDDFYDHLNTHLVDANMKKTPIILLGDFNGHIEGWASTKTNKNGHTLLDFARYWRLQILPQNQITYTGRNGEQT